MRRAGEAGFSLIEILVAVAVFAIAVTGLMALLVTSTKANASAADTSTAARVAESWLEQFRVRQLGWSGDSSFIPAQAPELAVTPNAWVLPLAGSNDPWRDGQPHDAEGRLATDANARKAIYCVHYRVGTLPAAGADPEVLVTVRVAYTADSSDTWPDCQPGTVNNALADGGTARAVVIPTLVYAQSP